MCGFRGLGARYTAVLKGFDAPDAVQITRPSLARADLDQPGKGSLSPVERPRGRWQEDGRGPQLAHRAVSRAVLAANYRLLQGLDRPPTGGPGSQPVDEEKQPKPYHVDEVPVPGDGFEAEMSLGREVASQDPEPDHRQHDGADRHVQAVESGQHEERRAVDAGAERQ